MQCSLKASEKRRGPRPPVRRSREQKSDVRRFQKASEEEPKRASEDRVRRESQREKTKAWP